MFGGLSREIVIVIAASLMTMMRLTRLTLLLQTCKKMSSEAEAVFFQENLIIIMDSYTTIVSRSQRTYRTDASLLNSLPTSLFSKIWHLRLALDFGQFASADTLLSTIQHLSALTQGSLKTLVLKLIGDEGHFLTRRDIETMCIKYQLDPALFRPLEPAARLLEALSEIGRMNWGSATNKLTLHILTSDRFQHALDEATGNFESKHHEFKQHMFYAFESRMQIPGDPHFSPLTAGKHINMYDFESHDLYDGRLNLTDASGRQVWVPADFVSSNWKGDGIGNRNTNLLFQGFSERFYGDVYLNSRRCCSKGKLLSETFVLAVD
ncbi:hypothetical protein BJ878DRAFT_148876 [Calycina marina]|uniref:Uncharacterized protein n=1 Tax=Calycina marina TaxID=1763456 RepID=A0A9P7Z0W4_9HELO|nr:hypothetical protein BJ878DRAFT_148876 [Calycina marina]